MPEWVITTNRARCRDCYRCVRTCPVKAVKIENGQAQIVPELCLACGNCVRACPQSAKVVRDELAAVRRAIGQGRRVVASVAPSAPAFMDVRSFGQIAEALHHLGFSAVGETAYGAEMVGLAHGEQLDRQPSPLIASSCPVVVNLVERYYPDLLPHLAEIVSPMVAHARYLKRRYADDSGKAPYVVFIGPCVAKKAEAEESRLDPQGSADGPRAVDAALTFSELAAWMRQAGVSLGALNEPDEETPRANARLFPVEGGLVATAKLTTDLLSEEVLAASGIDACRDVLESIRRGALHASLVELMACEGGCINGPAVQSHEGIYLARQRVAEYARRRQPQPLPGRADWPPLGRGYTDRHVPVAAFTEEQITEVLRRVDKYGPEDEMNCGACGYATCREKAIATLRGMAETTMCIPYMRHRAESLRQVVMDVGADPVIIVDTRLYVQDMSPSAERLLDCHVSHVVGRPLHTIMPVIEGFARVRNSGLPVLNEPVHLRDDLIVEQTIVPVEGQNLLMGVLRDVTERERHREELERLRNETLSHTQEVVRRQMRVAHEIAQLLGETTAETKMMLSRLADLLDEGEGPSQ